MLVTFSRIQFWINWQSYAFLFLLLALQPTMGSSLLSDSLPFCSFFTLLSPPSYFHYLHIFLDIYSPSLPWSPSNSRTYRFPLNLLVLTLRQLMLNIYIYMEHLFLMFLDHTQRRTTVGRTPLDE